MTETAAESPQTEATTDRAIRGGKVLVTGATGFVGGYVVRELVVRGYEPVCLVRNPERLGEKVPSGIRGKVASVRGDLHEWEALTRAAAGCQAAIHLVGIIEEKAISAQTFERVHV